MNTAGMRKTGVLLSVWHQFGALSNPADGDGEYCSDSSIAEPGGSASRLLPTIMFEAVGPSSLIWASEIQEHRPPGRGMPWFGMGAARLHRSSGQS
jgi:hypothetical protein